MLNEVLSTLLVFIGSANREIVKSALGFIKLSVHTLAIEMVMPHLNQLVPALLNWSGDHKNHFKVKVRHIFERMIRRFGWEAVYGCVGNEAENKEKGKVLLNIKKRKDRAKRKKAKRADEDEDEGAVEVKFAFPFFSSTNSFPRQPQRAKLETLSRTSSMAVRVRLTIVMKMQNNHLPVK